METEERYTRPNGFCPNPELWHSPDSEGTESEVSEFIGALVRMIKPNFVLETGTYHGHTALQIGLALRDNGRGKLVTIEKDRLAHEEALSYLFGFYTNLPVTAIHMNTMEYNPIEQIDFAFFDSWQEGRSEEFLRYYRAGFIRQGAIVAFHDSAPHHQVMRNIQPLIDDGFFRGIQFHTPRGLFLGQVI